MQRVNNPWFRLALTGFLVGSILGCAEGGSIQGGNNGGGKGMPIEVPADAKKTDSGLQYVDLKEGTGAEAKAGSAVEVHYTGWLQSNGNKFDSSLDRKKSFDFDLGARRVIAGWDEGVQGMKEGGKRKLFIPAKLGYGERGAGGAIPPGADLVFEVELLKVAKPIEVPTDASKNPSGLRFVDSKKGEGVEASKGRKVVVHYTGWLETNGKKFDSSVDRKDPFDFKLGAGEVIQGWDEGVEGMRVGGKRRLFIPSKLGYGERGAGRDIPGGANLVFDVELLEVR